MKHYWLRKWQKKLNIKDKITFEYISKSQVTNDLKHPYYFVGICGNTIYHDRRLTEEDILHELLHFKYPRYKESTIRKYTKKYLQL